MLLEDEAIEALSAPLFIERWKALYELCEWSSVFQSTGFVCTWYTTYQAQYRPVVVVAKDQAGELIGLLTLAFDASNRLCFAGDHQAEYQAWLASGPKTDELFYKMLHVLEDRCGAQALRFKYLLPDVPELNSSTTGGFQSRIQIIKHQRPLWQLHRETIAASLKKKGNRSKLNRLKREGLFATRHVHDEKEFSEVLDVVGPFYDVRQGAINNSYPFSEDPQKKAFHVSLLADAPEVMDVNIATLDNNPVSILITMKTGDTQHSAIIAHSPMLARHSVGKLHLMLAGMDNIDSGINVFDLTPGGDPWKERFASDHDSVLEVVIYRSSIVKQIAILKQSLLNVIKSFVGVLGITPNQLRQLLSTLSSITPAKVIRHLRHFLSREDEYQIFSLPISGIQDQSDRVEETDIRKNSLTDLLCFQVRESWHSKSAFLASAIQRLEEGETVYTVCREGILLHFGWLIERQQKAHFSEVGAEYQYPEPGAVLYDFYTDPTARGQGLYQKTITRMLRDLSDNEKVNTAYISCLAENHPSKHVIEKLGFRKISSITRTTRAGVTAVTELSQNAEGESSAHR